MKKIALIITLVVLFGVLAFNLIIRINVSDITNRDKTYFEDYFSDETLEFKLPQNAIINKALFFNGQWKSVYLELLLTEDEAKNFYNLINNSKNVVPLDGDLMNTVYGNLTAFGNIKKYEIDFAMEELYTKHTEEGSSVTGCFELFFTKPSNGSVIVQMFK